MSTFQKPEARAGAVAMPLELLITRAEELERQADDEARLDVLCGPPGYQRHISCTSPEAKRLTAAELRRAEAQLRAALTASHTAEPRQPGIAFQLNRELRELDATARELLDEARRQITELKGRCVDGYRSGYSAGWADGKDAEPMQGAEKAALLFGNGEYQPTDADVLAGMGTFEHGCDFRLRFTADRTVRLEYGCYGVHWNLVEGARYRLSRWLGFNGASRPITLQPETIFELKRREPCRRCGGFQFEDRT